MKQNEITPSDSGMGTLELSFDFELGWGSLENGLWYRRQQSGVYEHLRDVMPGLLDAMGVMDVPSSWATVGAMNVDRRELDFEHVGSPVRGWISDALRNAAPSTFDGRDLIDLLASSSAPHVIACHSYSHTRFSHESVDAKFVRSDLQRWKQAIPDSPDRLLLVFPQNHEFFLNTVRDCGVSIVRGAPDGVSRSATRRRLAALVSAPPLARRSQPIAGLERVSGSMFFNSPSGIKNRLPLVERIARRGLQAAVRERGRFLVWCHPFNFAENEQLLPAFVEFLREACRLRDAGFLSIQTT